MRIARNLLLLLAWSLFGPMSLSAVESEMGHPVGPMVQPDRYEPVSQAPQVAAVESEEEKLGLQAVEVNAEGMKYCEKGDWENALKSFLRASELKPGDASIQRNLALVKKRIEVQKEEKLHRANHVVAQKTFEAGRDQSVMSLKTLDPKISEEKHAATEAGIHTDTSVVDLRDARTLSVDPDKVRGTKKKAVPTPESAIQLPQDSDLDYLFPPAEAKFPTPVVPGLVALNGHPGISRDLDAARDRIVKKEEAAERQAEAKARKTLENALDALRVKKNFADFAAMEKSQDPGVKKSIRSALAAYHRSTNAAWESARRSAMKQMKSEIDKAVEMAERNDSATLGTK